MSSMVMHVVMGTVRLFEVAGMLNSEIDGAVVSARVIVAVAESGTEMFPVASLAKA